jgi:hypothetical protein
LFLSCQHLNSWMNLRECEHESWFQVQAVPVFRFDWREMCSRTPGCMPVVYMISNALFLYSCSSGAWVPSEVLHVYGRAVKGRSTVRSDMFPRTCNCNVVTCVPRRGEENPRISGCDKNFKFALIFYCYEISRVPNWIVNSSINVSVSLCVYVCMYVCMDSYMSTYLPVYLSIRLCPACLYICLPTYLPVYLIYLSVFPLYVAV